MRILITRYLWLYAPCKTTPTYEFKLIFGFYTLCFYINKLFPFIHKPKQYKNWITYFNVDKEFKKLVNK